jgi:hypothetical protein
MAETANALVARAVNAYREDMRPLMLRVEQLTREGRTDIWRIEALAGRIMAHVALVTRVAAVPAGALPLAEARRLRDASDALVAELRALVAAAQA